MSVLNHQPATPLPWVSREQGEACEYALLTADKTKWVAVFRLNGEQYLDQQRQNVAYLVHAAHAYRKTVEALQTINRTIYAKGAPLGTPDYFAIREAAVSTLLEIGEQVS